MEASTSQCSSDSVKFEHCLFPHHHCNHYRTQTDLDPALTSRLCSLPTAYCFNDLKSISLSPDWSLHAGSEYPLSHGLVFVQRRRCALSCRKEDWRGFFRCLVRRDKSVEQPASCNQVCKFSTLDSSSLVNRPPNNIHRNLERVTLHNYEMSIVHTRSS